MRWFIYTLKDPRTNQIRYVGFTSRKPAARLREHFHQATASTPRTHRHKWLLSLLSIGIEPVLEVVESGTGDGWAEAERRWIAHYRALGARLVNGTDGGQGTIGWGTAEDHAARAAKIAESYSRDRRSEAAKKWRATQTPEGRSRLAQIMASMPEKMSERGRKSNAPETRARRSKAAKAWQAAKTAEERSAAAVKGNTSRTPEQVRAAVAKRQAAIDREQHRAKIKAWRAAQAPGEARAAALKAWETKRAKAKLPRHYTS